MDSILTLSYEDFLDYLKTLLNLAKTLGLRAFHDSKKIFTIFIDYLKTFEFVELVIATVNLTTMFCYVTRCFVMIRGLTIEEEQTKKVFKRS